MDFVLANDNTEIFHFVFVEYTLLRFKEEVVFAKYLEYFSNNLLVLFMHLCEDKDIVHVYCYVSLGDEVVENIVHESLESGG